MYVFMLILVVPPGPCTVLGHQTKEGVIEMWHPPGVHVRLT